MTERWGDPIPMVGTEQTGTGEIGFVYEFTQEELDYLTAHGFERSQIAPETRWSKYTQGSRLVSQLAITPTGLELITYENGLAVRTNAKVTKGMDLIPLLVRAFIAEDI